MSSKGKINIGKIRKSKAVNILYDKGVLYFILSFLISSAIMLYGFSKEGIHLDGLNAFIEKTAGLFTDKEINAFNGNNQMLVVDLWHQYYPFFRVLREKLLTGGSLLYSWANGMGTNFLALAAYYTASPLNLLSVFADEDHVRDALTYILVAKVGFCGAFFNCFLRYTYNKKDFSTVVFSPMFALCSYTLGYYWNVMWFDTIALFPLVMLGITALCREGKWKLYTVSLALSLISNYYIGLFTCIFTVFMFLCTGIIECRGIKDFFVKLGLIIRSSVIGVGIGGFILYPAYKALQLTYSVNNTFPTDVSWNEKWTDIFANLLSYQEPTSIEGLPNLACGMLAVTLFGVFLFSGGIKIREKITKVLLLALIVVSCNENQLNFIWHGMHVTNQLPYRYSFIFSFILVSAAYSAYNAVTEKGIKIYQLVLMLIGPLAVFGMNYIKNDNTFAFEGALKSSVIVTAAYIIIFIAVKVFPSASKGKNRAALNLLVACALFSEFLSTAAVGVKTVGSSDYASYPACGTDVQYLLSDIREKENAPFYRTEMNNAHALNDSALYGYTGISQFSSSANVSVTRLFIRLGLYAQEAGNRYYYRISTPVVNSLFGVRYIISRYKPLDTNEYDFTQINSSGSTHSYQYKYPLSLGFMMDDNILKMEDKEATNPFEYQNELVRRATGIDYAVFVAQPVALASYDNMEVVKNSFGNYSFTVNDTTFNASSTYSFKNNDGERLYGYATGNGCNNVSVSVDGLSADSSVGIDKYPIVFPMGNGQGGSTTKAEVSVEKEKTSGSFKLMVYALREEAFEMAYNELADEQLEISEFSDTDIRGRITAKKSGVMYLSIPYEKGWSVYVDGKKTETLPVLNSMLGIRLESGEHTIRLKYIPDGFIEGTAVSVVMLLLFILFAVLDSKKRKRLAEEALQKENSENAPLGEFLKEQKEESETEKKDESEKEQNEESESDGSVSGDELPRVPDTEQCDNDTADSGEESVEGTE